MIQKLNHLKIIKVILFVNVLFSYQQLHTQDTLSGTFTSLDIPSGYNNGNYDPACNQNFSFGLPSGEPVSVTGVEVSYNMTSLNDLWTGDQRSQIYCVTTNKLETSIATGSGSSAGTQSYSRGISNIANGIFPGGTTLTFQMRAWRSFNGSVPGCSAQTCRVDKSTWKITIYFQPAPKIGMHTSDPEFPVDINGVTMIRDTLHIQKNVTTPWGHEWLINGLNKIWMKQSWSASTGDKLYLSSSGNRDNSLQSAIQLSEKTGISFGDGSEIGTDLSTEHMRLNEDGDLLIGRLNADNAKPRLRISKQASSTSGLLIENEDGQADSWFPYSDNNIYITGDRTHNSNAGRIYFRSYSPNGNYNNHAYIDPNYNALRVNGKITVGQNGFSWDHAGINIFHPSEVTHSGLQICNETAVDKGWYLNQRNDAFGHPNSALKFWKRIGNGGTVIPRVLYEDGSWVNGSDRSLKKEIMHLEKSQLSKLNRLKPSQYKYKSQETDILQFGLIAQELQKIYPNLVREMDGKVLGINYEGLIPVLVAAIQELSAELKALKNATSNN